MRHQHATKNNDYEVSERQGQGGCIKSSQSQTQIFYKDRQVRFYPDLAAEVHRKQKLRNVGIEHDMLIPARLLVTQDRTQTSGAPAEVESFIKRLQEENRNG